MTEIFNACVDLLNYLAKEFGLTYVQINVIIFCIIEPIVFIWMIIIIIKQKKQIKSLKKLNNNSE